MAHKEFNQAEANQHLQCSAPGCFKKRVGVSRYCSAHVKRLQRYGDVDGVPLKRKDYAQEYEAASFFINCNSMHPAVTLLAESIEVWLMKAGEGYSVPGERLTANLFVQQVKPIQIMTEVLAVLLCRDRSSHEQLLTPKGLAMALGNAVTSLAPRRRKANGRYDSSPHALVGQIGEHLNELLGEFTAKAMMTLREAEEHSRAISSKLRDNNFTTNQTNHYQGK